MWAGEPDASYQPQSGAYECKPGAQAPGSVTNHTSRVSGDTPFYFPMQNELKIKFNMSSAVVAPVISSSGRSAA